MSPLVTKLLFATTLVLVFTGIFLLYKAYGTKEAFDIVSQDLLDTTPVPTAFYTNKSNNLMLKDKNDNNLFEKSQSTNNLSEFPTVSTVVSTIEGNSCEYMAIRNIGSKPAILNFISPLFKFELTSQGGKVIPVIPKDQIDVKNPKGNMILIEDYNIVENNVTINNLISIEDTVILKTNQEIRLVNLDGLVLVGMEFNIKNKEDIDLGIYIKTKTSKYGGFKIESIKNQMIIVSACCILP